jgi:DnaJ-class molecular chaperone
MAAAALIVAALICGAGYLVSLRIWPETTCKRCDGSGKNAGSTSQRFGQCKRCNRTGRVPRAGTRLLTRRGR